MRCLFALLALAFATPAVATDVVSLSPYDWPGTIAPFRPAPVATEHPLYHRIAIEPVSDLPERIGSTFVLVAHGNEVTDALSSTLEKSNLLAPAGTKPSAILSVRWLAFRLPFKIGMSADAQATLRYELRRADTGEVIFPP